MLNEWKGDGDLVAEILMMRLVHSGSFLVVEGPDDSRFWRPRVAEGMCEIIIGSGKPSVVSTMTRLDLLGQRGIIGVVDGDYDLCEGIPLTSENLAATEVHDLECILLRSSALERLLAEHADAKKVARFEEAGVRVREAIVERALPFGQIRWLIERHQLGVEMDGMGPNRFVSPRNWDVDVPGLYAVADGAGVEAVGGCGRAISELPSIDPWLVVQGHDLLDVLRRGLQRTLGSLAASVGVKHLSAVLRAGLDAGEFSGTELYRRVRKWEDDNTPYVVLA